MSSVKLPSVKHEYSQQLLSNRRWICFSHNSVQPFLYIISDNTWFHFNCYCMERSLSFLVILWKIFNMNSYKLFLSASTIRFKFKGIIEYFVMASPQSERHHKVLPISIIPQPSVTLKCHEENSWKDFFSNCLHIFCVLHSFKKAFNSIITAIQIFF